MNTELPESLKAETNRFVDELQRHPMDTRIKILIALLTSQISTKDKTTQDLLASYSIVAMVEVLNRMRGISESAKSQVEDLLGKMSLAQKPKR